jgi:hypothetical protein
MKKNRNIVAVILLLGVTTLQYGCNKATPIVTGNYFGDVVELQERETLTAHPDRATRLGKFLYVRLGSDPSTSGRSKTFEDMPLCEGQSNCLLHRLVDVDRDSRTAVIDQQFYEGHGALLLDLLSGETIDLEDVPHIAPGGQYWIVADSDYAYGNGQVQIVARGQPGFVITAAEFQHSFCTFAAWRDDRTAVLYCPAAGDGGVNFDDIREMNVTRKADGGWSEQDTGRKVSYDTYKAP